MAKELEKDDASISVCEISTSQKTENKIFIISPKNKMKDPLSLLYNQVSGFPTLKQLRKKAWPKIS